MVSLLYEALGVARDATPEESMSVNSSFVWHDHSHHNSTQSVQKESAANTPGQIATWCQRFR